MLSTPPTPQMRSSFFPEGSNSRKDLWAEFRKIAGRCNVLYEISKIPFEDHLVENIDLNMETFELKKQTVDMLQNKYNSESSARASDV